MKCCDAARWRASRPVENGEQTLLIAGINVILNDALVQGQEVGLQVAYDVSQPDSPVEIWRRPTIDLNPATGLRFGSGVSAGSALAIDLGRGLLFGGTGQNTSEPYPGYPDPELAPAGYVDRSDSLYAIDIASGEFVWTNQLHAGDVFDLNAPVSTGPDRPDGPRDAIDTDDGQPDRIVLAFATLTVFNPGDDPANPQAAYVRVVPVQPLVHPRAFSYAVEDIAPMSRVNGIELDEPEPTHTPLRDVARVWLFPAS